jgi:serine/threonine protein kinase/tetratricopeptide (TPR) repeat protein
MIPPAECPPEAELIAFHQGRLTANRLDAMTLHIEGCPACEAILQRLDAGRDTVAVVMEQVAASDSTEDVPTTPPPDLGQAERVAEGTTIGGRYKLLEPIGEGGMGSVYMAQQSAPIRRLVALKLIKPGMDSRQVLARFEAERQALALMDHPNIARVFDAGTTEAGRPYFVMELVRGAPITQYCDENSLTLEQRLALFIPVCRAIQHAHQKGVIHRDIKPSNVLVALYDGRPVPKVIDFGIAKAVNQSLTDWTLVTGFGSVVGTPEYMAPEQAELNQLDVDTRADVYALGVLLYELLTGSTPLTRQRLARSALHEILRLVREEVPPTPSSRLSHSEALPSIAAARRTEPRRLAIHVRGDLDWVVMKALEKDRTRRYETANGLAQELERVLADEPVEAGPPSAWYRLGKFTRRYRRPLLVASFVAALLVAITAFSLRQSYRATLAERDMGIALHKVTEEQAKTKVEETKAKAEEARAREELANRKAVQDFFLGKIIASGRPEGVGGGLGKDVSLRRAIDAAAAGIGKSFEGRPLVEAAIRSEFGQSYILLGDFPPAIEQLEAALKLRKPRLDAIHPDLFSSKTRLGEAYWRGGRKAEALALFQEMAETNRARLGLEHPDTLISLSNLAAIYNDVGPHSEALKLLEQIARLEVALFGPRDDRTLNGAYNLGYSYCIAGRFPEAISAFQRALDGRLATIGPDQVATCLVMHGLAKAYLAVVKLPEAIELLEKAVSGLTAKLGIGHYQVLMAEADLATALTAAGRLDDVVALRERTLPRRRVDLGTHHMETLKNLDNLARADIRAGRVDQARSVIDELAQRWVEPGSTAREAELYTMLANLALDLARAGRPMEADELANRALAWQRPHISSDHAETLRTVFALGYSALEAGNFERARSLFDEFLAGERKRLKPGDPFLPRDLAAVGSTLLAHGRAVEAEPILRECLSLRAKIKDDHPWELANARSLLGATLAALGRPAEAGPLLVEGYLEMKAQETYLPGGADPNLPLAAERLARFHEAQGQPAEAERWRAERATYPARQVPPTRE